MMTKSVLALAAAQVATAHYGLIYPEWRADTLADDTEYDQWVYPCAGAPFGEGEITQWPLDGGSLELELHHDWTYVFINAGLGNDTTDFNITMTPSLWNATGSGTLCIDKLPIPEDSGIVNGSIGSIQVITVDGGGAALYNCADILFVDNAPDAPSCNGTIEVNVVHGNASDASDSHDHGEGHGDHEESEEETGSEEESSEAEGDDGSDAAGLGVNMVSLSAFAGLATVFVMGLGM